MVYCSLCKHGKRYTSSIEGFWSSTIICDLDDFTCNDKDNTPCDFYVPLDADNSKE